MRGHREYPAIRPTVHRRIIHLLGVGRWTDEDAGRRGPRHVGRRIRARPEGGGDVHHPVVPQLAIVERGPPAVLPVAVHPTVWLLLLPLSLDGLVAGRGGQRTLRAQRQIDRLESGGER